MAVNGASVSYTEAQCRLIEEYLKMAEKMAVIKGRYFKNPLLKEKLRDAAQDGLMRAAINFDPSKGSFETYAKYKINGAMLDALREVDHLTRALRSKLRKIMETCETSEEINNAIDALNLSADQKVFLQETARQQIQGQSFFLELDAPVMNGSNGNTFFVDTPSNRENPEDNILTKEKVRIIADAIEKLPLSVRDKKIVRMYFYDGDRTYASAHEKEITMKRISDEVGIVESRISQIISHAEKLLKKLPSLQAIAGHRARKGSAQMRILQERSDDSIGAGNGSPTH